MKFSEDMQPTEEMLKAGIGQLLDVIPGLENEVDEEQLSDAIRYIWRAMVQESK